MESKSSHSLTKKKSWWNWQNVTCTAAPSRTVSINTDSGAANHAPNPPASHLTKNSSPLFKVIHHTKSSKSSAAAPANMPNVDRNTFAEYKKQKATMAAKARVRSLRSFLGIQPTALKALDEKEKEEYKYWHDYSIQEQLARQRFEKIAEGAEDVEVMMKGWRLEHPLPYLSAPVRHLVNEQAIFAAHGDTSLQSAYPGLPPLSEDILWNSLVFIEELWTDSKCQVCFKTSAGRPVYRMTCGDYMHVSCFEENYEMWMKAKGPIMHGAKECIHCKALKRLVKNISGEELEMRIRRIGDKLLPWKRPYR